MQSLRGCSSGMTVCEICLTKFPCFVFAGVVALGRFPQEFPFVVWPRLHGQLVYLLRSQGKETTSTS